ncbi:MAG: 50S ribosomal protein L24 [Candidatus Aenigmatarchaeota archaeon]|nr:MAG: 50S ribosomal protein L24 [Candidatus Aenigmarchaeota archaeon]
MRKLFSISWVKSKQPRKQRKYRYNAPKHIRQKFMHANLSKELRKKYNIRSLLLRKGDKVKVMRGKFKGKISKVSKVDLKKLVVYLEDVKRKKVDGREVQIPIQPSNLQIVSAEFDDKKRAKILERKSKEQIKKEK